MSIKSVFNQYRKRQKFLSFYKKFIRRNDLCFDIGANRGERTEAFLQIGARVISVEPQLQCINFMKQKFSEFKNIQFVQVAISNKSGGEELFICEVDECSSISKEFISFYSSNFNKLKWASSVVVPSLTLDELIKTYGVPSYCKVDTEGLERKNFEGLSVPIKNISFEFNFPFIQDTIECVKMLNKLGKPVFNYVEFENMQIVLKEWQHSDSFIKVLSSLKSNILTGEVLVKFDV